MEYFLLQITIQNCKSVPLKECSTIKFYVFKFLSKISRKIIYMNMDILVIHVLMTIGMWKEDILSLLESMASLRDWC